MGRVNIFYWPNDVVRKMQTCFQEHNFFSAFKSGAAKLWHEFAVSFSSEEDLQCLNTCLVSQLCEQINEGIKSL